MTVEQRDKYAYELMVKNNPEEAVKQLLLKDKVIEETQQSYTEEYNLRHKLSFELSVEKDKVLELSNQLALYSSEETMLKEIDHLKAKINKIEEMFDDETLNKYYHGMSYEFEIDEFKKDIFKITKGE